jgi:hypothetical protein
MCANESAGRCDRAAACFQLRRPQVPGMNHMRPNLEVHPHVRRPRPPRDADRVIEQGLGGADLHKQRR